MIEYKVLERVGQVVYIKKRKIVDDTPDDHGIDSLYVDVPGALDMLYGRIGAELWHATKGSVPHSIVQVEKMRASRSVLPLEGLRALIRAAPALGTKAPALLDMWTRLGGAESDCPQRSVGGYEAALAKLFRVEPEKIILKLHRRCAVSCAEKSVLLCPPTPPTDCTDEEPPVSSPEWPVSYTHLTLPTIYSV